MCAYACVCAVLRALPALRREACPVEEASRACAPRYVETVHGRPCMSRRLRERLGKPGGLRACARIPRPAPPTAIAALLPACVRAACVRVASSSHQPSAASALPSRRSPAAPRPSPAAIVKGPPPHSSPHPPPPPNICFPLSILARTPWPQPAVTGLSTRVPTVNIRTREATAVLFKSHTPICPPASRLLIYGPEKPQQCCSGLTRRFVHPRPGLYLAGLSEL